MCLKAFARTSPIWNLFLAGRIVPRPHTTRLDIHETFATGGPRACLIMPNGSDGTRRWQRLHSGHDGELRPTLGSARRGWATQWWTYGIWALPSVWVWSRDLFGALVSFLSVQRLFPESRTASIPLLAFEFTGHGRLSHVPGICRPWDVCTGPGLRSILLVQPLMGFLGFYPGGRFRIEPWTPDGPKSAAPIA